MFLGRKKYDHNLIVIGSGSAGAAAALAGAKAGRRVAIIENNKMMGNANIALSLDVLLNIAQNFDRARNSSRFGLRSSAIGYNYPSIQNWRNVVTERLVKANSENFYRSQGISVYHGQARFSTNHEINLDSRYISSEDFLIASGSSLKVPDIEGLDKIQYLTPESALNLSKPPKSICIIGAGRTGCEFAELFSIFGSKVYLAEISPRILPREDSEVSSEVESYFNNMRDVGILTKTKILKIERESSVLTKVSYVRSGRNYSVKVDKVLLASGKSPNVNLSLENAGVDYSKRGIDVDEYLMTSVKNIYAAGQVLRDNPSGFSSSYEGKIAVNNLLRKQKIAVDYRAVPRVTRVTPEVASVGLSEAECMKRDLSVVKTVISIKDAQKSIINDEKYGLCKLITDKKGVILGASVVAPHASEIIHELSLAIQMRLTANDLASSLHAPSSWSEIVQIAAERVDEG